MKTGVAWWMSQTPKLAVLMASALSLVVCAGYKGELEVRLDMPEKVYISPENQDGLKDELVIPVEVPRAYEKMQIGAYRFTILDAAGRAVRTTEVGDTRLQKELKGKKQPVEIPESLRWDGTSDDGRYVADGEYTYVIEAWDMQGNGGRSAPLIVVADNTPPHVELSAPYTVFSPNGDGRQDVLPVIQSRSTSEERWTGELRSGEGRVVLELTWEGEARDFTWDGRDAGGNMLPDGDYTYTVASTDLADNSGSFRLEPLTLDSALKSVRLDIEQPVFSPNGDGVKDTTAFLPRLESMERVVSWTGAVKARTGAVRRVLAGKGALAERIVFDGRGDDGRILADGQYFGTLSVVYANGDNPEVTSPPFTIDTERPTAAVAPSWTVFSPDGDGNRDTVTFGQSSSDEESWEGIIRSASGRTVVRRSWERRAADFTWDGRDDEGLAVEDGLYVYSLSGTDAAGNTGSFTSQSVVLDTRPTPVGLSVEHMAFSPNGDGTKDSNPLHPKALITEGIEGWSIEIRDRSGATVRTISETGALPGTAAFDGRSDAGRILPDGLYTAQLTVLYEKGNRPQAQSPAFSLDNTAPTISVSAGSLLFSPDGDGRRDTLAIRQLSSNEDVWEGAFLDPAGTAVRRISWKGQASSFEWDGRGGAGRVVLDGLYTYTVTATDRAGNTASGEIRGIRLDTRGAAVSIQASAPRFSPNGDGIQDTVALEIAAGDTEGVKSWTMTITDSSARTRRTFSAAAGALAGSGASESGGGRAGEGIPSRVVWDGADERGRVEEGAFEALLSVEYERGTVATARSSVFQLDVSPPQVGVRLSPQPFSPDDDGIDDVLTLELDVRDRSPIKQWSALISDPVGQPFFSFSGRGSPPGRLTWNGRSEGGELVQSATDYPLAVSVTDDVGNSATVRLPIAVDVLVLHDAQGRLRISISSIYFKPYTADYRDVPRDRASRNLATLDRLAEILTKFSAYRIHLEGHAVREYWQNPKRAQREESEELIPLSQSRAEAVKAALVERGIAAERMTTQGYGGTVPVVPHGDRVNHWKNRRVEFILRKSE